MGLGTEAPAAGDHGGLLGAKPPATGQFLSFFGENNHFSSIWITFLTFLEPFERSRRFVILKFGSHKTELICLAPSSLPYLQVKFKTHLNACILGLNVLIDLAKKRTEAP